MRHFQVPAGGGGAGVCDCGGNWDFTDQESEVEYQKDGKKP